MKIYFASLYNDRKEVWDCDDPPDKVLLSYHYGSQVERTLRFIKERGIEDKIEIILDSGAFSCWNKGISIDIQRYCQYIRKCLDTYKFKTFYAVNLDVIPGKQGEKITKEQAYDSMMKGFDNYMWFKKQGIETIHVYHQGESEEFLLNTIIKECKYIGVSPCNDSSIKSKNEWCNHIFNLLPEGIKSHGFAVTSVPLMSRYPWWSVDSASWCRKSGFGNILTKCAGELVFSTKGRKSFLSGRYGMLKETEMKVLLTEFKENCLEVPEDINQLEHVLKHDLKLRNLINYKFLRRTERELNQIEGKDNKYVDAQLSLF